MMLESSSLSRDVKLEIEYLDFNYCEYGWASEFKEVVIHNDHPFRIKVSWITTEMINSLGQ